MAEKPDSRASQRKKVFVVHGRNAGARQAMFDFLRSIGLQPIEWSMARSLTKQATPLIETIIDTAFQHAQAIVVLFTPDEIVALRDDYADGPSDPDLAPAGQSRPNVIFEAGMAMGRHSERTVLVEFGIVRRFSDIQGRLPLRFDNTPQSRQELADRLETAGCETDLSGQDWYTSGTFVLPPALPEGLSFSSRAAAPAPARAGEPGPNPPIRRREVR
jgi:predicted nucleotide-binding protein